MSVNLVYCGEVELDQKRFHASIVEVIRDDSYILVINNLLNASASIVTLVEYKFFRGHGQTMTISGVDCNSIHYIFDLTDNLRNTPKKKEKK